MAQDQFDQVSVVKKANVTYRGRCVSHTVLFADGQKKMLGVVAPCDKENPEYRFETHTAERIEVIQGECQVRLAGEDEFLLYRAGQKFMVNGNSSFVLKTNEVLHYVCHLEG